MKLEILELAMFEINDTKEFYNLQLSDLGERFKKDVQNTIDKITDSPKLYPVVFDNIRRSLLHRFPFSVIYSYNQESIIILSVAHQSRMPFYWVDRIV